MSDGARILNGLSSLDSTPRAEARTLWIGSWRVVLEGLDPGLAASMDRRWGLFMRNGRVTRPRSRVQVVAPGPAGWFCAVRRGERYRMETQVERGRPVVRSYGFVLGREPSASTWRLSLRPSPVEPTERALENAIRYLAARLALEDGGFALHGAGVLRSDRAFIFAGPSGSGKTTAVSLCDPCIGLGDDFAVVVPEHGGWAAPAVPFDNREQTTVEPPRGLFPVAGVWRLFQAREARVDTPSRVEAAASLLACAAFPWALPDLSEALLENIARFVLDGAYRHLHFTRSESFWDLIAAGS